MYDPAIFYEDPTDELRPGDIFYIKNWNAYEDSYWMILTSFCDLDNRDRIILSKISPIDSLTNINAGDIGNIQSYRVFYYFYLPQLEGEFPESIVHYGILLPFSREMLDIARRNQSDCRQIISLSDGSRGLFQFHFANHITRDVTLELFKPYIKGYVKLLKK